MRATEVTHVLYHGDCEDGFGAAWCAWQALGDQATYLPVYHGQPPPDLPSEAKVAIVDFSYPRDTILELESYLDGLIILDHHLSAQRELAGLSCAIFDMDSSGARLAWKYWHPGKSLPPLIEYIEDKDLWRFKLPHSKEINVALHSYPQDFSVWSSLTLDTLRTEGVTLLRFQERVVQAACDRARWRKLGGYEVPVVNATEFRSEIANRLCKLYPEAAFAGAYYDDKQGRRVWSLRSVGEFDVAAVAKAFGGGGHRNAAGFVEPTPCSIPGS